jgi:hypothetical protein
MPSGHGFKVNSSRRRLEDIEDAAEESEDLKEQFKKEEGRKL